MINILTMSELKFALNNSKCIAMIKDTGNYVKRD